MKKIDKLPAVRFRVGNYSYRPREKSGPTEGFSIRHYLVLDESGEVIEPDFTPWCYMSKIDVQNYVMLGKPSRFHEYRPLSSTDLRKMINGINR
jgi:hypothetical protein